MSVLREEPHCNLLGPRVSSLRPAQEKDVSCHLYLGVSIRLWETVPALGPRARTTRPYRADVPVMRPLDPT